MENDISLASKLLQINAIKLSPQKPFQWASGLNSPIYCDNRLALSHPDVRTDITRRFAKLIVDEGEEVDLIAGVATSGIAFGALVANELELPFVYVRSKAKGHGRQNRIEGKLSKGQRCVVIEDLISTGGSCLNAVDALRETGAQVLYVAAIFSYQLESAENNFREKNCHYQALSNYSKLINYANSAQLFSRSETHLLQEWRKDPSAWSAAHRQNP